MTCEVVVANRLGIALAADSAVTFTAGNSDKATYASGANKIFQLASSEPVAVMVYSKADLSVIPWEIILKRYRKELGSVSFASLGLYANDLINWLNLRTPKLLPPDVRSAATKGAFAHGVLYAFAQILAARPSISDASLGNADLAAEWQAGLQDLTSQLSAEQVDPSLDEADIAAAHSDFSTGFSADVHEYLEGQGFGHLAPLVDGADLVALGLQCVFRRPQFVLSSFTGVVVAGYGDEDFLPGFVEIQVYGFVGSKVYWRAVSNASVNNTDIASFIEPFARKAMVETFTQGASPEVWKAVREAFTQFAAAAVNRAASATGSVIGPEIVSGVVENQLEAFSENWARSVLKSHLLPLRSIIGSLSVEDLAELAETMVQLESLKEKVTARTQGVGGPVDVAVITKSEGLVWIKRKHYFNPEINQRYLLRLQRGT